MAQTNSNAFKTSNRIAVENREVFNRESNFVTDLADSAYNTLVISINCADNMAVLSGSGVLPAHSVIEEVTAVCTTAFTTDSGIFSVNIGSASLAADGGVKANIMKGTGTNRLALTATGGTSIPVGQGFSTHGHVSAALGSIHTASFASTVKGNNFYTADTTLHAQLSSSGASVQTDGANGVLKVCIRYNKVL